MQEQGGAEPVFWWWQESAGARVVVLTPEVLVLSSPLSKAQLASMEAARQAGAILDADLGSDPELTALDDIRSVRHLPDERQVVVSRDSGAPILITPSKESGGVAAGVFGALHDILAPGREPVETISLDGGPSRTALWGLAALAAVFTLGAFLYPMSLVPAGLCVVAMGVLVLREDDADETAVGGRVVEIPLGPDPVAAAGLDAATDFDRPLLAPERTPAAPGEPVATPLPAVPAPTPTPPEPQPAAAPPTPTPPEPQPAAAPPTPTPPEPQPAAAAPTPTAPDPVAGPTRTARPATPAPDVDQAAPPAPSSPAPPWPVAATATPTPIPDDDAPKPAWATAPAPPALADAAATGGSAGDSPAEAPRNPWSEPPA